MESPKRIWEESQYARSLIEASLDPLITINTQGKIMDMNQATVNITGLTRKKLTGTDFFNYFTEPLKARDVYKEVFINGYVANYALTLRHKNGKLTDVMFNGSVYKNDMGIVKGVVIIARDVTEQKRITKEFIEAKVFAEMAKELAEEAKLKAECATRIAESSVKAKQQFLSNMSHEIRTPMNAIIGFTKVLLRTELSEKQKEYLNAIEVSGSSLIVLINDILDLAKVDSGKMVFEQTPFNLSLSISAMLHLFEPKIREKNLILIKEYDSNIPKVLVGDPVRLHQVILNLVSNSVKFTSNGEITVSIKLISENEKQVSIEFSVKDTGIGIDDKKLQNIFENFQQATSDTSRLYGGTGLGLAIVKQLVESQNGKISVNSKIGEGSNFSFQLSLLKTNVELDSESEIVESDTKVNLKILVVEDIPLNQLLMKTLMDDFGFECDIASNGKIAVDKLQGNTYDLILMDLQMPVMNGFEATDFIRKELKSQIPIMALTADVTTVDLEKCKAVGMDDYISKPVDDRLLRSKILKLVKKKKLTPNVIQKIKPESKTELKYCNQQYLNQLTKSKPELMIEMITLYINQTKNTIKVMNSSLEQKDWIRLQAAAHKMIPSFSIMGINKEYEDMARKVQKYTSTETELEKLPNLVSKLDFVCTKACEELKKELIKIKNNIK
jgi:PAS domain S-box-containing protein